MFQSLVGGAIVIMAALMAIVLAEILTAKNRQAAFGTCFVLQALVVIITNLFFLVLIAVCSAYANNDLNLHK